MIHSSSLSGEHDGVPRMLSIMYERRHAIFLCTVASCVIAAIGYAQSPTQYKSEAILALDVRKLQALPTESVVSPLPQESPVLRTELDIIGSRSMAERVLMNIQKAARVSGQQAKFDRFYSDTSPNRVAETSKLVSDLMKNVRVMNDGRSYTIYISYYASDPIYAATVANAFGEAYLDYQIDLQTTATRRVAEWLGDRLGDLRAKLEESERQVSEFREKSGLIDSGGMPLQAQRLSGLNVELTALQAKLAGAKARLATALEVQQNGDELGLTEVLSSPAIQLLRAEQSRVLRGIQEMDGNGARMNPQLPQLMSQLDSLKVQIKQEISQVIASLRNEIGVTEKQRLEVEADLQRVQQAISSANMAVVQSAQLDREAAANRSIYETYLARYKQTIEQDGIATAEARIISRAMPSSKPTSPDKLVWSLLALVLSCCTGFAAALILHYTDTSIGSITTLQRKTGLPVIARIPRTPVTALRSGTGIFSGGAAAMYGAFADLQTYIQIAESKVKVIAFTSSTDREGTTFVVANLARSLALSGVKLVVIDANLRNPGIGSEFEVQPTHHLVKAVNREISFDDVIQHDRASSVDVVIAETDDSPPNLILGSKRFAALVSELRNRYEIVLIDAPSLGYDLDLMRIASLADTVALVVRQEVAKGAEIQNALVKLRLAGTHITGIILNGVRRQDRRRNSRWLPVLKREAKHRSPKPSLHPVQSVVTQKGV
ncbi:polysaccharide biosynthesis protein [Neorhizobium lilium]|uniref:Polysaccharide biosynthesis protein n=1 Tax=Neorhizobium lilium TaxID=2503024 RepID=A0A3S3VSH9_9HYPH|nr:polysaccharide biosynthesis tyrosine autokinase [Neorhizobium lilium]RWX80910.1 polysaccharide biosynthesis protein [Neorhizobium lilium]